MLLPVISVLAVGSASGTKLIIDTDIGGGGCNDVDDVVAVCIAWVSANHPAASELVRRSPGQTHPFRNALADNGEAELIAVVQNTAPLQCAGAISVLNNFCKNNDHVSRCLGSVSVFSYIRMFLTVALFPHRRSQRRPNRGLQHIYCRCGSRSATATSIRFLHCRQL